MWTELPDCTLRVGLNAVSYSFFSRHQRGGVIYHGQLGKRSVVRIYCTNSNLDERKSHVRRLQ